MDIIVLGISPKQYSGQVVMDLFAKFWCHEVCLKCALHALVLKFCLKR